MLHPFHIYRAIIVRIKEMQKLCNTPDLYRHQSYFPDSKRHYTPTQVFVEQIKTIFKYGKVNEFYFPYGFDVKNNKEKSEYLHYWYFRNRRQYLNFKLESPSTCLLRNKLLFSIYTEGIGLKTGTNLCYSTNGEIYDFSTKQVVDIDHLIKNGEGKDLFCKIIDGECGKGIFKISIKNGIIIEDNKQVCVEQLDKTLRENQYLVQTSIDQHPVLASLHEQSINSIRLVTVRSLKDGIIRVFPSILRIGTGNSIVDNTSQGGICVGINTETGKLNKYGFYKPQFGLCTTTHPDSNIEFDGFQIPFWEEAKKQAIYFHSMLPGMHSVGWDVAITKEGPVFIEGNDNWEINGPQICHGGLKHLFDEYFYE